MPRSAAISLKLSQNWFSRLTLVLCSAIVIERFVVRFELLCRKWAIGTILLDRGRTRPAESAARGHESSHKAFGRSEHTKSQRSCRRSSRLGQSPFSSSFHFIMFALRPYF